MLVIFPPVAALALGVAHLLIDTRRPLAWWNRVYQRVPDDAQGWHIAMWSDQVLHLAVLALAALVVAR